MKCFRILSIILLIVLYSSVASADIYEWTDANGIRHFTNYAPPIQARILLKTDELPYDEAADKDRLEAESLERLEHAKLALAEKEAALADQQREVERAIAEADQRTEEALQLARYLAEQTEKNNYNYRRGYGSYIVYPYYKHRYKRPHKYKKYYRHGGNIHPNKNHFSGHFQGHRSRRPSVHTAGYNNIKSPQNLKRHQGLKTQHSLKRHSGIMRRHGGRINMVFR